MMHRKKRGSQEHDTEKGGVAKEKDGDAAG